jgi:hypothetical protein
MENNYFSIGIDFSSTGKYYFLTGIFSPYREIIAP